MLAAAALMFAGCSTEDGQGPDTGVEPDEVSVAPEKEIFTSKGGSVEVVVTSSGEWELSGGQDWATPSAVKGDDGDVVKFTVKANETDQDLEAVFVFTVGKETARLTLIVKKKPVEDVDDEVYVAPEQETIEKKGGFVDVIVTSTGSWTLTGGETWATPSATSGDDGDVVRFTVDPNAGTDDLRAVFTFTVGEATADFTVICKGGILYFLEIESEEAPTMSQAGGEIEVLVNTNTPFRDLTFVISEESEGWMKHTATLPGENGAKLYFEATANDTFEDRVSVITIEGEDDTQAIVTITQDKKARLEVEESTYVVELAGGPLEIPVISNVDYEVQIAEEATWISYDGKADGKEKFTVTATELTMRDAVITFAFGEIKVPVKIIQKADALINVTASMAGNRAWPVWYDSTPVTNMEELTMEALIYVDSWKVSGQLNSIMGIENRLLMRTGDAGKPNNMVEICVLAQYNTSNTSVKEYKITLSNAADLLPAKTWHHLAVTYSVANQKVEVYVNGVNKGSVKPGNNYYYRAVNIGIDHSNEDTGTFQSFDHKRVFWVGYAYEAARFWPGQMSEVRIWNKVLTADEIAAENHFYTVDPDSEGLVAYWKFNDGKSGTQVDNQWASGTKCYKDVVKDHTKYGNHLYSDKDMTWNIVSVPQP